MICVKMLGIAATAAGLAIGSAIDSATGAVLVSHYEFDGNTADSVAGGPSGTVVDFNGSNPPSGLGAGKIGSGSLVLQFGDYMSTTPAGRPVGEDFDGGTIAMWIKTADNLADSDLSNITLMGSLNSSDSTAYLLGTNGVGNLQLFPRAADGSQSRPRLAPGGSVLALNRDWADGQWRHIAIAFSFGATNGTTVAQWYIDGAPVDTNIAEQSLNNTDVFSPWDFDMILGGRNNRGAPDQFLPGGMMLDDVRVYNGPLTASEIASLYAAGIPEPSGVLLVACCGLGLLGGSRVRPTDATERR